MSSVYTLTKTNGTPLLDLRSLESNGTNAQSVPRQIVDITFGPGTNSFVVADDVTARFVAGFIFQVTSGAYAGIYTVSPAGSTYGLGVTTIPVTTPIVASPFEIAGVVPGVGGVWLIEGLVNGDCVFYPNSTFVVSGNGIGDGTYTVASANVSGSYTILSVTTGPTGTFTLLGNHTAFLSSGTQFRVSSTPGGTGNGLYTVGSVTSVSGNTVVTVSTAVPTGSLPGGILTPSPAVTRVTVAGTIPIGAGTNGTAQPAPPAVFTFSSPPTGLTPTGPTTWQIIWHLVGNHATKFVPGCPVTIKNNNIFPLLPVTVVSAANNGANTDVVVAFKFATTPTLPNSTGILILPTPALPYGLIQYSGDPAATSLKFVGKGVPYFNNTVTWGEALQQNFVGLLENFNNTTPPASPLQGQLWFETGVGMFTFGSTIYDITAVNPATNKFTIPGNQTAFFAPGNRIAVYNNIGIDVSALFPPCVVFEVQTVTFVSGNTEIVIDTTPTNPASLNAIPAIATSNGKLYNVNDFHQLLSAGFPMTSDFDMGGFKLSNLADATLPTDGLNLQTGDARYVNLSGDTMTGALNMGGNVISNIGAAVGATDVLNQAAGDARYVNVTGDTMTGFLTLNANPTAGLHAANKSYVDSLVSGIMWIQPVLDAVIYNDTLATPPGSPLPFFRTYIVKPQQYVLNGINIGAGTWQTAGNVTADFPVNALFYVEATGITGGFALYQVLSSVFSAGNTTITIKTVITPPSPAIEGLGTIQTTINAGATATGNIFKAHGAWNGYEGRVMGFDGTVWVDILGRPAATTDRFGIYTAPDNDEVPIITSGMPAYLIPHVGKLGTLNAVSFPGMTQLGVLAAWTFYTPTEPDAFSVIGKRSLHFGSSYTFRGTYGTGTFNSNHKWIEFSGPASLVDGAGLFYTGNVLNIGAGFGIIVGLNTVAVDQPALDAIYINVTGDTMTGALTTITPTIAGHAANKGYVDTSISTAVAVGALQTTLDSVYVNASGDSMTGTLTINSNVSLLNTGAINHLNMLTGGTNQVSVGHQWTNSPITRSFNLGPTTDASSNNIFKFEAGRSALTTPMGNNDGFQFTHWNGTTTLTLLTINRVQATFNLPVDVSNNKITSVATPTLAQDATNKTYVDTALSGKATVVSVPTLFSSPGAIGEVAMSATFFYWYDGARWQRVASDATWV